MINSLTFMKGYYFSGECSHIVNIFDRQEQKEVPTLDKGNLYLSGVYVLQSQDEIIKAGIKCVLSIIDRPTYKSFKIPKILERLDIKHHKWIDLEDYQEMSIYPHLDDAHAYIKSMLQEHNVLVHCQMGMSRSSSLVIAFLMKQYGMDYRKAKKFAQDRREIVQPNEGFERDLKKFEVYLKEHHPEQFKEV